LVAEPILRACRPVRAGAASRTRERTLDPMSLFDSTQLALEAALRGASLRQELLTNNVANINTPGYQRQDVDFHAALRAAQAAGEDPTTIRFRPKLDPTRT